MLWNSTHLSNLCIASPAAHQLLIPCFKKGTSTSGRCDSFSGQNRVLTTCEVIYVFLEFANLWIHQPFWNIFLPAHFFPVLLEGENSDKQTVGLEWSILFSDSHLSWAGGCWLVCLANELSGLVWKCVPWDCASQSPHWAWSPRSSSAHAFPNTGCWQASRKRNTLSGRWDEGSSAAGNNTDLTKDANCGHRTHTLCTFSEVCSKNKHDPIPSGQNSGE